jgi:hypothetical protein
MARRAARALALSDWYNSVHRLLMHLKLDLGMHCAPLTILPFTLQNLFDADAGSPVPSRVAPASNAVTPAIRIVFVMVIS